MGARGRLRGGLVRALLVVTLLTGALMGLLWTFQRQLVYHPDPSPVPAAADVIADALAAVAGLRDEGYPPRRTIYFGESLGGGVVAALARERPPAGVVLRSPFTELADVGSHHYPWLPVRLLLRDRFPVLELVRSSDVPLTVVYGDRDPVVPSALSSQVASAAPRLAEELVLEGAGHNDPVMFGPRVADAVARLAERVR